MAKLSREEIKQEMYKVFPELKSLSEPKRSKEEQKILSQVSDYLCARIYTTVEGERMGVITKLNAIKVENTTAKTDWNYGYIARFICIGVAILTVIIVLIVSGGNIGGSKEQKNTCGVCGRTFSYTYDKENYKSVRNRNMCLNCYNNYKQGTQAVDDIRNNGV